MPNSATHVFSTTARILHWLIAGLIVTQYVLAQLAERAAQNNHELHQLALLANHKSLGLTLLALVIMRIIWRLTHRPPPSELSDWQRYASQLTHGFIYCLIVAIPLSGWVLASASAYGISWFNLFEFPSITPDNVRLEASAKSVHDFLATLLFFLVILHALAALMHRFFWRDNVLSRMSSPAMLMLFGVTTAAGVFGLGQVSTPESSTPIAAPSDKRALKEKLTAPASLHQWQIDYSQSHIRFRAEQAGAMFDGEWLQWQAEMYFSEQMNQASFDVRIDVTAPDTADEERDTTLLDEEWFDVEHFPTARFQLDNFATVDDELIGNGLLRIKDHILEIPFKFTVETIGPRHTLRGAAQLDRLAFGLGTKEWADTSWVGQYVDVDVLVIATTP